MPSRKKSSRKSTSKKPTRRVSRKRWTAADLKVLRQEAGKKSGAQLSRLLKRSEPAVRFKASVLGISLRQRGR
jgi:hypothetical protein